MTCATRALLLILAALVLTALPTSAQEQPPTDTTADQISPLNAPLAASHTLYLPTIQGGTQPPNPFGFDLRSYSSEAVMEYVTGARPKWSRAGDLLWSEVEPVRGGGYRWETMATLEANIARLRQAGIEPMVIVMWSPPWAQSLPGEVCSPPRPEHVADFVRFVAAAAERYSSGPLQVDYWEIWNEPDFRADQVGAFDGTGCWATSTGPYYGGDYYGAVLKQVYPALKAANPRATVLAGAFAHFWPDDSVTTGFLRGMLAAGAASSFDTLTFHAYNDYEGGDRLLFKANSLRRVLASYGVSKPLMATEIAATCVEWQGAPDNIACPADFVQRQANYAARIYAMAIALDLQGAFWYTLASSKPGFLESHLIDNVDGALTPRPAYNSFRNSALLLQGARYIGPPVVDPPPTMRNAVQVLTFQRGERTLYVFWVPETDFPKLYNLPVPPGVTAICTDQLNLPTPARYYCSDANRDGVIPRAVNELPQYVEVLP
jgi:hypothetical protein